MTDTRRPATNEPAAAPVVPPTAMSGNRRLACSRPNPSAMSAQNMVTQNMLKTLIQTKNVRPVATPMTSGKNASRAAKPSRLTMKKL